MDTHNPGAGFGQLALLLLFVLPAIFFLLTQQRTLSAVRRENRELRPGLVWLQLIPIFTLYWMFVVVTRIADSLSKEFIAWQDDSILGIPDSDAVRAVSNRPTYKIGMSYCVLNLSCPFIALPLFNAFGQHESAGLLALILSVIPALLLTTIVCWIIYWVKLAGYKKKLDTMQPA